MNRIAQLANNLLVVLLYPIWEHQRKSWIARLDQEESDLARNLITRKRIAKHCHGDDTRAKQLAYLSVCEVKVDDIIPLVAPGKQRQALTTLQARQVLFEMHLRDVGLTAGEVSSPTYGDPRELPVPAV